MSPGEQSLRSAVREYNAGCILPGIKRREIPFDEYRDSIAEDGDFLLWEPHGITSRIGRFIATVTDGPFCHASGIAFNHGQIWSYQYEEGRDGFGSPLWYSVKRYPGLISVFRIRNLTGIEQHSIARHYVHDLTGEYAWPSIRGIALSSSLGLRMLFGRTDWYRRLTERSVRRTKGAICSQHIHRSIRIGAGERRKLNFIRKDEAFVTPNDLGMWGEASYVGTLVVPAHWKKN